LVLLGLSLACTAARAADPGPKTADGRYVLIGWNDLGMHCMQPRYDDICILPPANTIQAVVIRRGVEPSVSSSSLLSYSLLNNQQVTLHNDFWNFAPQLFGVNLAPGIGLAGNGVNGTMKWTTSYVYEAKWVPALPESDNGTWNPFQAGKISLKNSAGTVLASTQIVVPVSDEMSCQKCHATGGIAAPGIAMPTLEQNILKLHDMRHGTNLVNQRPVLCAKCHSDNALGAAGTAGVPSLSYSMHTKHASLAAAQQPNCYDCHPGPKTQCNRSAIQGMAGGQGAAGCVTCHGDLNKMATDLKAGRQPWLQEPTCAQCHGTAYSTGTTLFRNARGHGGIRCITCHNSPHAWLPSLLAADNAQAIALQGNSHAIGYKACFVCHTDGRMATMPPHHDD
jgi:hypothetical protein